jgi:NADH-quinone oxidoreductase subunit I
MKKIVAPDYDLAETVKRHGSALKVAICETIHPHTVTTQYPKERKKQPDCFRGYLLFDPEACISCFQCSFICPANAIGMKEAPNKRYYPTIDYGKCIFCYFCLDSCPGGALKPTKIHDVAYKDMDEMLTPTEAMIEIPEIVREDTQCVEYVIDDKDLRLERIKGKDDLSVELPPVKATPMVSTCVDPESCIACKICKEVCESGSILYSIDEEKMSGKMVINTETCNGCGLCVKECSMQILKLVRRGE